MNEMFEAAKFYRNCIEDVRKSTFMEIQQDSNSIVIFLAKIFESSGHVGRQLYYAYEINGEAFDGSVELPRKLKPAESNTGLLSGTAKHVAQEIAKKIAPRIVGKIREEL